MTLPDEAHPLLDELDGPLVHEPVSRAITEREVKPFEIIWTIAHDRLIPMSQALEILKSVKWEEVEL